MSTGQSTPTGRVTRLLTEKSAVSFTRPGWFARIPVQPSAAWNTQAEHSSSRQYGVKCTSTVLTPRDFTSTVITSEQLKAVLKEKSLGFEVAVTQNGFSAESFEEMYTLCRFFVFEDCLTPERVAALSEEEARALDARIREHTARCRGPDGVYRLTQDDELILLSRPA